jgi:WhiB family redox-sensing transcriptional regulator
MSWQNEARCREHDPELFFSAGSRSERRAKAICGRCPVMEECRAFALETGTDFGVWGGLNGEELRGLRRRGRALGRPALVGA